MKKIVLLLLCLSVLCGFSYAAQAVELEFNETVTGAISENNEENKYTFELFESGTVSIEYIAENIECAQLKIYNEAGQEIWDKSPWWNSTSKQISFIQKVELVSGQYTLIISKYNGYGTYELNMDFEATNESFVESQEETNNSFRNASQIEVNEEYVGQIAVNDEVDNYEFTLEESGGFELTFTAENIECAVLKIYDEAGQEIWDKSPWWNSTSKQISYVEDVELTSGTYYFTVSKYNGYGTYSFDMDFEATNESFVESQEETNNSFRNASQIEVNEEYAGQIAVNDEVDNYEFTLEESGGFELTFTAENIECAVLKIYDEAGQEIWDKSPWWNSTSEQISYAEDVELTSGTYYFTVSKYNGYGKYSFDMDFNISDESFAESQSDSDNSFKNANEIEVNEQYIGQIAINDEIDTFTFDLSDNSFEIVFAAENIECAVLKIYDEAGQEIWDKSPWWNSDSKQILFNESIVLTSGTYYFTVSKYNGYGTYTFGLLAQSYADDSDDNEYNEEPVYEEEESVYNEDDETTSFDSKVSEWAKDEVEQAYQNDLIPDTIIGDDLTQHINRAEFAAIAVQLYEELSGEEASVSRTSFNDIDWNENEISIKKAYSLGITDGIDKTTFAPDEPISREQLATMLCRAIKKYSFEDWTLDNDSDYYLDTSGVRKFADDSDISLWAKSSVYYMAKLGIIQGVDSSHFAPRNTNSWQEAEGYATATREQAILMALRIFKISDML